jgi:dihydrolipoamide dehydrogenase
MADADLLVVGGGPAGISAALRARELGARVILFERERVGGACLHRGCVPTVDSLELANRRRATQEGPAWGLETSPGTVEMAVARRHRDRVVERLYRGTRAYLEQVGVQLVEGEACLLPGCAVEATIDGRTEKFTGRGVVLAVGAAFALPEVPGVWMKFRSSWLSTAGDSSALSGPSSIRPSAAESPFWSLDPSFCRGRTQNWARLWSFCWPRTASK